MALDFRSQPFILSFSLLWFIYAFRLVKRHNTHNLPPGPKGLPFVGSLLELSWTPWNEFELWKEQYGPLVYLTVAGQGILVVNEHKIAVELLERRGRLYGDRPPLIVAGEILTSSSLMVTMPLTGHGDRFKRMRRACHEPLSRVQLTKYYPIHMKSAVFTVAGILENPSEWQHQMSKATATSVLSMMYGLPELTLIRDKTIENVYQFILSLSEAFTPGKFLVEYFPWMMYLPSSLARWKRDAEEQGSRNSDLWQELYNSARDRINDGEECSSLAGTFIREQERHRLTDSEGAWLCANIFAGGFETLLGVVHWFILAMIAFPEVQKKCHEELDAVVGRSRMPTFEDRDRLPYLQATLREAVRWRPVAPVAGPHFTNEDDWYQGYFIPKGTICFPNVWSMNRDKSIYGNDADNFNPGRFIDENGQLTPALPDTKDGHLSYGFGPRICPGRHMANNGVFINIACILWATKISPVKDELGNEIIPDIWTPATDGLAMRPSPYKCSFLPRFPEVLEVVAQTKDLC